MPIVVETLTPCSAVPKNALCAGRECPRNRARLGAAEIAMRLNVKPQTGRISEHDAYAALLELEGSRTRYRMIR